MKKLTIVLLLALGAIINLQGQDQKALLDQLLVEDASSLSALALYPAGIRNAILITAKNPEVLVRLESMQLQTSKSFQAIMAPLDEATQEDIYDLTRYPDLLAAIVNGGPKRKGELQKIAAEYPEEVQPKAIELGKNQFETLKSLHELNRSADQAFQTLMKGYSQETRAAVNDLISQPEVMDILIEDMRMTVLVGDLYQRHPQWVMHKMDSLNIEGAKKNAAGLEDWKNTLQENPEALDDLTEVASEYAEETGYEKTVYETRVIRETVYVDYVWEPYPWWYGHPHWRVNRHHYNYWYPYPYWYHWGFYYGPGGGIVVFSQPSWYFMDWYWYTPNHYYHHPYFAHSCVNWSNRHRESMGGLARSTRTWQGRVDREVPNDFWKNDGQTVGRIRELGKFEQDYNQAARNSPVTREAFLNERKNEYPSIAKNERGSAISSTPKSTRSEGQVQPNSGIRTQPVIRTPQTTQPRQSESQYNPVYRARDYHQNTWDQARPSPSQRAPTQSNPGNVRQTPSNSGSGNTRIPAGNTRSPSGSKNETKGTRK